MSSVFALQFLRFFPRLQPVCTTIVRYRRGPKRSGFVANRLDPDQDFYLHEELEEEPVAYLHDGADLAEAAQRPQKLTPSMEREMQRALVKKEILKKKAWRDMHPKEPALLTWAARAQIRHLNKMDPDQWDPETLARSFPVSPYTIKEVLRSKLILWDLQAIQRHDRGVYMNWMKLKEQARALQQGQPVEPRYRSILEDEGRRSLLLNAAGIVDLPVPQEQAMLQTQVDIAQQARPRVKPTFSSILPNCPTDLPDNKEVGGETIDKHYIGLNDPEMVKLLEDIASVKKNDVLSIEGENFTEDDLSIRTEQYAVDEEEEPMFQRHSKAGHSSWAGNREENSNKKFNVKNRRYEEHETWSKQESMFTNRDGDKMEIKPSRSGKNQEPFVLEKETNRRKHRDRSDEWTYPFEHSEEDEGSHYAHQDNRNRNYGSKNKSHRDFDDYDDNEDPPELTGSLGDINVLYDKPKESKPKKVKKKISYKSN